MEQLEVDLGERSYPIHIGPGLLAEPGHFGQALRGRQVLIVTNSTVGPLYRQRLRTTLREVTCFNPARQEREALEVDAVELPDGEAYKTLDHLDPIFTRLLERGFDRSATIVALGGGVVGDMAGFAAACYQRGIDFIQVPTTLLAQVDSSVGGKTGVNHRLGKNMIGAFHQPQAVVIDTDTLATLDERQFAAGLAEVIKYGVIGDADLFAWLEAHMGALVDREPAALTTAIRRSCEAKAAIVAADEREGGQRALLNLGHTFGHAIETGIGYGRWLHGEAVAAGILMAADLARRLGWLSDDEVHRIEALTVRAGLPTRAPADLSRERFLELMRVDKKAQAGEIRLVLPTTIGNATVTADYDPDALAATLDEHHALPARLGPRG
ncbi:3-dehydroquinate synthase [Thiohalospira sp.]|uniref:3-dehydroquinate synthase n=1 Tax=Thiohalospira sp. TaxID=3080549 RepID=UPI00398002E5